jgi:hypothetical protein
MEQLTCRRCDHRWYPRSPERPVQCPKCRSVFWDKGRLSSGKSALGGQNCAPSDAKVKSHHPEKLGVKTAATMSRNAVFGEIDADA